MADTVVETGEDGGSVTYVGGKVVEQETSGETPDGDHGDELAAAKAAVKKALAGEAEEVGKTAAKEAKAARERDPLIPRDRGPDGKFLPSPAELEESRKKEDDEDAGALRKALSERKEAAKYKAEVNAEIERQRNEVRQFYQQLQREKAALQAESQRLAMLRKDPIRAIKENGWDPEQFILDIAQDGTPEGQARRQQMELQQQIRELNDWKRQQAEETQRQQAQFQQQQRQQFRQNVETQFLSTAMSEEKHPHVATMYKGNEVELLAQADAVADRYRAVTGKEATFDEISEYLEERTAKWYKEFSGRAKAAPPVTQGRPSQGSASGKKSLNPAGSSERRTLGTSMADLDGDERLEAAKVAVRAAIHASGNR